MRPVGAGWVADRWAVTRSKAGPLFPWLLPIPVIGNAFIKSVDRGIGRLYGCIGQLLAGGPSAFSVARPKSSVPPAAVLLTNFADYFDSFGRVDFFGSSEFAD